ncbi:hypothetical protein [Rahnella woolbedingensis]|uniref:DUF4258 domain-containing protein n=1 Tax=Rahnella woolbedingensis TaxID=1510574 RepID=A0A419NE79_9GAMM|nr:hypothetical protein [Rahnella woolbedingensis]RJT47052.1 hypothetical protein D6C13_01405 [Rahnella woolbedingensis]
MSFREIKWKVIECLKNGNIEFEARREIQLKNLLSTGDISPFEVAALIGRASGDNHQVRPHHFDSSIDVHIITVMRAGTEWYIKWYFTDPISVFISVHH